MGIIKIIWDSLKRGKLPKAVIMNEDGKGIGKCPKCNASVTYSEFKVGDVAFNCDACGETAKWTDPDS